MASADSCLASAAFANKGKMFPSPYLQIDVLQNGIFFVSGKVILPCMMKYPPKATTKSERRAIKKSTFA